jgi:hypothetical protein
MTEVTPTEGSIVFNSHTDTLYSHDFRNGEGKYINIITTDESGAPEEVELELTPRLKISLTFIKVKKDISGVSFKKFRFHKKNGWIENKTEGIVLSNLTFRKLIGFLQFLSTIDPSLINERRIALTDVAGQEMDSETTKKVKTLLTRSDGPKIIEELLKSGLITSADIVNVGYRKKQLDIFKKLLNEDAFFEEYRNDCGIKASGSERIWQYFFETNHWIFGHGLNYFFNQPLEGKKLEQVVQGADVAQSGKRADGLLKTRGVLSSLCLVEIKTHRTPLLKVVSDPYRPDCWQVSDELNGGISQSQKTVQKTIENTKLSPELRQKTEVGDPTGEIIYSYQPKSYLIIGNLNEFQADQGVNREKFASFDLYRKNMLHPEIITFDELYERAKFIVHRDDEMQV